MKKLLMVILILSLLVMSVSAEDDLQLTDGGIAPDSSLYFIDQFFDQFGDELTVKEERVAEIKLMVENEDYESAKIALEGYYDYAEKLEQEVSPERKEEVIESAALIEQVLNDLESQIHEDYKEEFVDDIINQESDIATAAEIADKINELCRELSELDPVQYYEICKTDDDSPKWLQELDEDLTNEQIAEAKNFGEIMSECFETSGQDCRCEEIPFDEFADVCSKAAPLAVACDIEGDEEACDLLNEIEMPELPEHLQEVFDDLEDDIKESQYDMHTPEECKDAILEADVSTEEEGREICDKIMMEIYSPECVEAGITDQSECDDFYDDFYGEVNEENNFYIDFDCQEIEDSMERLDCYDKAAMQVSGYDGYDNENYDGPCMTEEDWSVKKAECRDLYGDNAGDEPIMGDSGDGYECSIDIICIDFGQYGDSGNCMTEEDWSVKKAECRDLYGDNAGDEPIMGDSGDGYECPVDLTCIDFGQYEEEEEYEEKETDDWTEGCDVILCPENTYCEYGECVEYPYSECSDGCEQECGDQNTDCVNDQCVCLGYGENGPPSSSDDSDSGSSESEEASSEDDSSEESESSDEGSEEEESDDNGADSESTETEDSSESGDSGSESDDSESESNDESSEETIEQE